MDTSRDPKIDLMMLGIDPGRNGAIVVLACGYKLVTSYRFETERLETTSFVKTRIDANPLNAFLKGLRMRRKVNRLGFLAYIEQPLVIPHSHVTNMAQATNYGIIIALLKANNIPAKEIRPHEWKACWQIGSDKRKAIEVCGAFCPELAVSKMKDADIAEAYLIARYGLRYGRSKHADFHSQV